MHSVVRVAMRQFLKLYSGFREGQEDSPDVAVKLTQKITVDVTGKDADYIIMVDMDRVLQLLIQVVMTRISYVEESLATIYTEGDENGDGVLSFQEFLAIVTKVAPHYPRRRVLKMFREALQIGDGDSIDRTAFVAVCKRHDLIQLVDIVKLSNGVLYNLCDHHHHQSNKNPSQNTGSPNDETDKSERRARVKTIPVRERKGLVSIAKKLKPLNTLNSFLRDKRNESVSEDGIPAEEIEQGKELVLGAQEQSSSRMLNILKSIQVYIILLLSYF